MTKTDGKLVLIVVPSEAPICTQSQLTAIRSHLRPANIAPAVRLYSVDNSTITTTATDCADRWLEIRTTIP
jgi:Ser/Thr protein kinase RdoA (MazF antagonist)